MTNYKRKREASGAYFPLPNSIFRLGLTAGEILVYAYLMYCEDRETYQCHPSYSTIGDAVGMSKNTVKKHVDGLRNKRLITTEYTTVRTKDGRVHNGSLRYTLQPIEPVEEAYFRKRLRLQNAESEARKGLEKLEKKHDKERKKGANHEAIDV